VPVGIGSARSKFESGDALRTSLSERWCSSRPVWTRRRRPAALRR